MNAQTAKPALEQLAEFVSQYHNTDIESDEIVRLALIDTLGCMFIGARESIVRKTLKSVSPWGQGSVPVFGTRSHLPAPWAALINATSAHCLDLDDWEIPGNSHPSAVLFPALLAAGHQQKTDGQTFVGAYIAGFEIIARLGEAMNFEHYDSGWHTTSSLGAIGAAAAVSRLFDLNAEKTTNALALSVSMAGGLTRQFGSDAKPLHAGLAAKSGLMAASFAAHGLTAQADVLEGKRGYYELTCCGDDGRLGNALQTLGHVLEIKKHGLIVKAYPACGYTHRLVDCALSIHKQMNGEPPEIKKITASLPDFHAAILPFTQPRNRFEALFSAPFCCATALLKGRLTLDDFNPDRLTDAKIKALIAIIDLDIKKPVNPQLNYDPAQPDWLEAIDSNGKLWRAECSYPLGAPQIPMSAEQIYQKFESNSGFKPTGSLINWTQAPNINQVIRKLSP